MADNAREGLTLERLAALLREAEAAHATYERASGQPDEDWPTWYAAYMLPRLEEWLAAEPRP